MFFDSYFNMEFVDKKPSDYSYNVTAEPKEPDIQPDGSITATLDFMRGEKDPIKPQQSHSKSNETIYSDTESDRDLFITKHYDLAIKYSEEPELCAKIVNYADPIITIESKEKADIQADSKRPSSNFAKARII